MEFIREGKFGREFLRWLEEDKNLKERSAKDVLSHLKRASKMIDLYAENISSDDLVYFLAKNEQFSGLSQNIKSHLRRAVRLFHAFMEYSREKNHLKLF